MPSGNGARAKQKRERNAKKAEEKSSGKSQLDSNKKAQSILCKICRQPFMCNAKKPELDQHRENKHPKNEYKDCFDVFV